MDDFVLAIEWSSRRLSVAARAGNGTIEELAEEGARFRVTEALELLDRFLGRRGLTLSDCREIRIGRGPGNYSGVRQAFAWTGGAAAPGGIRPRALSSGRAQAVRLTRERGEGVAVLGDARRGMWWGAEFESGRTETADWRLDSPEGWRGRLGSRPAVSAEAERLGGLPGLESDFPRAADLLHPDIDDDEEPFEPLYLHPPVG